MNSNVGQYTVSEISFGVKKVLESSYSRVRVRGEVSGYRGAHSSGHAYFALKDDRARLDAVVWRGNFARLRHKPEEGMEVIATGKISSYPGSSKYQLIIDTIEPAGAGALMKLLEERRRKLAAEGLFDQERKKPLPFLPAIIGVITSPTGAVIRDILHRLNDRFPVRVIVWPVRVQGESSAAEVTRAINGFNRATKLFPAPDLIIIARGGGSLEDLWPFNDEQIVRAADRSAIPVISAIGHETDWTLLDHVADYRAPTPTGAAEIAVPVRSELLSATRSLGEALGGELLKLIENQRKRMTSAARTLPRLLDFIAIYRQRFDLAVVRFGQGLQQQKQLVKIRLTQITARLSLNLLKNPIQSNQRRLGDIASHLDQAFSQLLGRYALVVSNQSGLLSALGYKSVLGRGFVLVRDDVGKPLYRARELLPASTITIEFVDGEARAQIIKKRLKEG